MLQWNSSGVFLLMIVVSSSRFSQTLLKLEARLEFCVQNKNLINKKSLKKISFFISFVRSWHSPVWSGKLQVALDQSSLDFCRQGCYADSSEVGVLVLGISSWMSLKSTTAQSVPMYWISKQIWNAKLWSWFLVNVTVLLFLGWT